MRRSHFILWGVLLLGGCHVFTPPSSVDLYMKGQLETERGDLDAALKSLSSAIDRNPQMGLAYIARGDIYKQRQDYQKAADDFEKATQLEPYNFNANYQLGLMYQYLKRFADAVAAYQKAVEIRPLDPDANMGLALVYTQTGQPLRGLPYAQRAVQGNADSANTHANLGILYAQLGYDDAAIASLKKSIELNSRQPEVYLNLGQEYIKAGKFDEAKNVLSTAQQLAPSPAVSERLGFVYYKLKNFPRANEAFTDSLRQDGNYYLALNGLGVIAMTQALTTNPPDVEADREAIAYWDRSLKIQPNQPLIQQLVNKYAHAK